MKTYYAASVQEFETGIAKPTAAHMMMADIVAPPKWQGVDVSSKVDMQTREILNHTSMIDLSGLEALADAQFGIAPDLPWCDDHFDERVCGAPINPGTQWAEWRLGAGAKKFLDADGMFNHNYMERIWPRFAHRNAVHGPTETAEDWWDNSQDPHPRFDQLDDQAKFHLEDAMRRPMNGIRKPYGDLKSLIELLEKNPMARQAFLPMFFPEDTGSEDRTPCSLGWHFIMRNDQLHMVYYLRSCDFVNHWRNDIYMAIRLLMWVLAALKSGGTGNWKGVELGTLTTHITSLHTFRGQEHLLKDMT